MLSISARPLHVRLLRLVLRTQPRSARVPLILAGGGALTPGRYVQHGPKPMCNLLLNLADKMRAQKLGSFGDSTGRLGDV